MICGESISCGKGESNKVGRRSWRVRIAADDYQHHVSTYELNPSLPHLRKESD